MSNLALVLVDVVSAVLCFALLRFMLKPYSTTGEERYLGLPLGFALLGVSYLLAGVGALSDYSQITQALGWIQISAQAYAFAVIATSYYFSKKTSKKMRLWWTLAYPILFVAIFYVYLIIIVPPNFVVSSFADSDLALLAFNILFLAYVSINTLMTEKKSPSSNKIWIPYAFLLLCFSQFCLVVWSLDSSFLSYVTAYFLRMIGLTIFLVVTYQSFHLSTKKEPIDAKDSA